MPVAVINLDSSEASPPPDSAEPARHFLTLCPPVPAQDPALLDWAQALADLAEERVAALEARISHLETLVSSDELTGLLNRRGFLNVFARANAAAKRGSAGGAVIVCDLDGFKKVNDLLGHAEGDEVLRRLGAILRSKTRKMDAVGRLGGDEFALLLIGATEAIARRKCLWLSRLIGTIGLGASFGIASYDGNHSEELVLHRADMAMYEDKRRNAAANAAIRP